MPTIIYYNGNLAIVSFNVEENRSGSWVKATGIGPIVGYRFAVQVLNNSGLPGGVDLSQVKLADLLNPANMLLPGLGFVTGSSMGTSIAFSNITIVMGSPSDGLYRFYKDSNYNEPWTANGRSSFDGILQRGQRTTLHVYFKWGAAAGPISPLPGSRLPQVSLNARELRIVSLPNGPIANLQPNTT